MNKIILWKISRQTISIRQKKLHFQNISYPDNERDLGDFDGDLAGERCEDLPFGDLLHTE